MTSRLESPVMNEHETAEYIGMSVVYLRNHRGATAAPPHMKFGAKSVRYHRDDVDAWMQSRRVVSEGPEE